MSSPLQQAQAKWNKLSPVLTKLGHADSTWIPIAQQDFKRVKETGSGMTTQEIVDSLGTITTGKPTVNPEAKGDSGVLGFFGNAMSDVQDIATGAVTAPFAWGFQRAHLGGDGWQNKLSDVASLVPGVGATVNSLLALGIGPKPQVEYVQKDLGLEQHQGGDSLGDQFASALRNVSKLPLGQVVPGVRTASNLTTEQGRSDIAQHPLMTALDVAPVIGELGKVGLAGRDVQALHVPESVKPALESVQAGKTFQAAGRAVYDVPTTAVGKLAEHFGKDRPILSRSEAANELFNKFAVGKKATDIVRTVGVETRKVMHGVDQVVHKPVIEDYAKLPEADRRLLTDVVDRGDPREYVALNPEQRVIVDGLRSLRAEMDRGSEGQTAMIPDYLSGGKAEHYALDDPIVEAHTMFEKRLGVLETAKQSTADAEAAWKAQPLDDNLRRDYVNKNARLQAASEKAARSLDRVERLQKGAKVDLGGGRYKQGAPPARFRTLVQEQFRAKILSDPKVVAKIHTDQAVQTFQGIMESSDTAFFNDLVGKETATRYWRDAMGSWTTLKQAGYDPMFVSNIPASAVDRLGNPVIPKTGGSLVPRQFKRATFDMTRSVHDVAVAMTAEQEQLLQQAATKALIDEHLQPVDPTTGQISTEAPAQPKSALDQTYRDKARELIDSGARTFEGRRIPVGADVQTLANQLMNREWEAWSPGGGFAEYLRNPQGEQMMLPKGYAKTLRKMSSRDGELGPFSGARLPGTNLFKHAVMIGPRHMAHIGIGGLMFTLGREPAALSHIIDGYRMAKGEFIPELMHDTHSLTADHILNYQSGKTQGRLMGALRKPEEFMRRIEENLSNSYKIAVALQKLDGDKALVAGTRSMSAGDAALRDTAFEAANKVAVDIDSMQPIERQLMRSGAVPFMAFSHHLMRYLATYPADHPLRAAFITNVAKAQKDNFTQSLPGSWQNLFYVGTPDAQGNIATIDIKNVNPFRSTYNMMTLAGVFSQLNPAFLEALKVAGVNPLSATPELHPDLKVDPQTGQLVMDRNVKNDAFGALATYVPEANALDLLFNVTSNYKTLKATDPGAYQRALWSSLNIPFEPSTRNIPVEQQKLETRRYTQAQKDVTAYTQTGDYSQISHYDQVPVPAWLKPYLGHVSYAAPEQVKRVWDAISASYAKSDPGVDPRSLLPTK